MTGGKTLSGGCDCGNLKVNLTLSKAPQDYELRECLCSFCQARKGLYVSDPKGRFEINVADDNQLERYRFGSSTADFYICRTCDGFIGAIGDTETGLKGVANIKCLDHPEELSGKTAPHDYDDETTEVRLARRNRNWTPVIIVEAERR